MKRFKAELRNLTLFDEKLWIYAFLELAGLLMIKTDDFFQYPLVIDK